MGDPDIGRERASAFAEPGGGATDRPDAHAIASWLIARVAERVGIAPEDIDVSAPFAAFGLTSRDAVGLSGELEECLGCPLSATLVYEHPTINALARHLSSCTESPTEPVPQMGSTAKPIAVIGMACRFPGADSPEKFWDLLRNSLDATGELPKMRRGLLQPFGMERSQTRMPRRGGFLAEVDGFDARFFQISPREASRMDPQQRLLLETAWEALEDGGQVPGRLAGTRTGVFIGISNSEYGSAQLHDPTLADAYVGTGNALSIAANRISYCFDFQGPSIAVDTACSSSLVAIHLACRSLCDDEATLALVGGANLILSPALTINFAEAGFMARDGRCKAFDARANGYARGEGVAIVVLKRLSDAVADGDPIRAVIRGSAIRQDGRSNGLTAPSRKSQEAVLREAYRCAGVSPGRVHYVEAHGTGTELGDPIEALALGSVLATDRPPNRPCVVGSVKTNIGHLEAAAGIAGLMKASLMLERRMVPPSLHFEVPNPHIPFGDLLLRVPTELEPWPDEPGQALAGVSSFGFGGTNAHVVLEEPPASAMLAAEAAGEACIVPLSARSSHGLRRTAEVWTEFLGPAADTGASIADLSYTACARRTHHDHRMAFVVRSREQLIDRLHGFLRGAEADDVVRIAAAPPKLVFVFSGQGTQWSGMGRELLECDRVFRAAIVELDEVLREFTSWSVLEALTSPEASSRLGETEVAQPLLFALQVALAALWRSWGIAPDALVGHSLGEVAAAHVAGALDLQDAARIVFHRSSAMGRMRGRGRIASLDLSLPEAERAIADCGRRLSIAAHNGPASVAVSGDTAAVEALLERQHRQGVFGRLLPVEYAFHSEQMDAARAELERALEGLQPRPTSMPLYSTVNGRLVEGRSLGPAHWGKNVREPVHFAEAMDHLAARGHQVFVEIGAHPVLASAIDACLLRRGERGVTLPSLSRGAGEKAGLLQSLATLHTLGHTVDWSGLFPSGGRCVSLPTYCWEEERFWFSPATAARKFDGDHPLLGRAIRSARPPHDFIWERDFDRQSHPFLDECRVDGAILLPMSAYVGMALAAAAEVLGRGGRTRICNLEIREALVVPEEGKYKIQVVLSGTSSQRSISIYGKPSSSDDASWRLYAQATMDLDERDALDPGYESLEQARSRCAAEIPPDRWYSALEAKGFHYGPFFRGIRKLWRGDAETVGEVAIDAGPEGTELLHRPGVLDIALQVLAASATGLGQNDEAAYLPVAAAEIIVERSPGPRLWCHAWSEGDATSDSTIRNGHVRILDEKDQLVVLVRGVRGQRINVSNCGVAPASDYAGDKGRIRRALQAAPRDQRQPVLESYLRAEAAVVLRLAPLRIALDLPLRDLGLDSLMAVILRNRIDADLEVRLPVTQLLSSPSITRLAAQLLEQIPVEAPTPPVHRFAISRLEAAMLLKNVDRLSDVEVDALLGNILGQRS